MDLISVADQLGNRDGDYVLLSAVVYGVVIHQDHVMHHARIVLRKSRLRALLKLADWISSQVNETADPDSVIAEIMRGVQECRTR